MAEKEFNPQQLVLQFRQRSPAKPKETLKCARCGNQFQRWSSDRHYTEAYCSRECYKLRAKPSVESRFWPKVKKTDSCWIWIGSCNRGGYGTFKGPERPVLAHRISWEIHFGPIPGDILVLHKCDNPPCVRPDHLFLGTDADNMADMARKGRACPPPRLAGERNHKAKLTESDIRAIRLLPDQGMSQTAIAKMYGRNQATISSILLRKSWKHVE